MLNLLRRYRELILVAVLITLPLGVYFARSKRPAEQTLADRLLVQATAPVERLVGWAVVSTLRAWDGYVALRGSHQRAQAAVLESARLTLEVQALQQERAENERLRRLVGLAESAPRRDYLGARVIGAKLGPDGLQLLTIDRGSDDGVARAMPVVVAEGVVGRIHTLTGHAAEVLLVIDRNSSVAVRVERTRVRANVRGQGTPDLCRLDYALRADDIIEGDLLITSGTDAVFPPGLPVGRATRLQRAAHGLFQEGAVIPVVDPTRLEEVLVVISGVRDPSLPPAASGPEGGR